MSVKTRYEFIKKVHSSFLIIFVKNKEYYSYGVDLLILKQFRKGNMLEQLKKYHIHYLLIDNIQITDFFDDGENKYEYYYYFTCLKIILKKFGIIKV